MIVEINSYTRSFNYIKITQPIIENLLLTFKHIELYHRCSCIKLLYKVIDKFNVFILFIICIKQLYWSFKHVSCRITFKRNVKSNVHTRYQTCGIGQHLANGLVVVKLYLYKNNLYRIISYATTRNNCYFYRIC